MQLTRDVIKEKVEQIEAHLNQYKDGLITGAEALIHIGVVVDDPVVSVIHQYDVDSRELCNKTTREINELEVMEIEGQ